MKKQIALILFCIITSRAIGQELEPRVYANLPKGVNAISAVYGLARGNVVGDPSAPIKDLTITTHNVGAGYVRTFGLFNKLARVQVSVPFIHMSGQAKLNGVDTSGTRTGFGDSRIRLGINLIGSPALDKKDFNKYQQNTIVGLSLVTAVPTGVYYNDKAINIGSHRWAFKPELGLSHRFKHVYAEVYMGVWFYTNNTKYLQTKILQQQPLFSSQAHASYYFKNHMWAGIDANWFSGGRTSVDNTNTGNLNDNWRVGAVWSVPVSKQQSVKLQFHVGAFTNTGYDYNIVSLGYQYVFF